MGKNTLNNLLVDISKLPRLDEYSSTTDAARQDALLKKVDKTINAMNAATRKAKGYKGGGAVMKGRGGSYKGCK